MKIDPETWAAINEPIKHLFDSLRNLGISASIVAAANFFERTGYSDISDHDIAFMRIAGYVLAVTATIHFAVGLLYHVPAQTTYSKKMHPRASYSLHVYMFFIFLAIAYLFTRYAASK